MLSFEETSRRQDHLHSRQRAGSASPSPPLVLVCSSTAADLAAPSTISTATGSGIRRKRISTGRDSLPMQTILVEWPEKAAGWVPTQPSDFVSIISPTRRAAVWSASNVAGD